MGAAELDSEAAAARRSALLAPLAERPDRSAIVCDVDGTLAPIVPRPEDAALPPRAREVLDALRVRYALVACLSGRRAVDARRVVGLDSLAYVGNHGLEVLAPGAAEATIDSSLAPLAERVAAFAAQSFSAGLRGLGVTLEDKQAIWAFHWRRAPDQAAAEDALRPVGAAAAAAGLVPHWGRKVLEVRPPVDTDKGTALAAALTVHAVDRALYGGDDTTDLDAFRRLRSLREVGGLAHAVCVGVRSDEGPAEIVAEADLVVEGPEGFVDLLALLA
jgi:trehalose 6-phosphate phosphatase